jgi:hypothetical protein
MGYIRCNVQGLKLSYLIVSVKVQAVLEDDVSLDGGIID